MSVQAIYQVRERDYVQGNGVADATGALTLTLPGPGFGMGWLIERAYIAGPTQGNVTLYRDSATPQNGLDYGDSWPVVGDEHANIWIPPNTQRLVLVFAALNANAQVGASFQYRVIRGRR